MRNWAEENNPEILTMRGLTRNDFADLKSPWAITREEEDYLDETMGLIAETIDQDSTVYTMFNLLVLASPSQKAVPSIAENPLLKEIQIGIILLMYRYLATKAGKHKL